MSELVLIQKDELEALIQNAVASTIKKLDTQFLTVNKETLSQMTGLTVREIEELTRKREIPFIEKSAKKYLYEPQKVLEKLRENEVQAYV